MLKKYGFYLWVLLLFLVACGQTETAVIKPITTLASKQAEVVPSATLLPAEFVGSDGVVMVEDVTAVVVETAVLAPIIKQGMKAARVDVVFVAGDVAETAVLPESVSNQATSLLTVAVTNAAVIVEQVVGETAVLPVSNAGSETEQQTNQNALPSVSDEQENNNEDNHDEDNHDEDQDADDHDNNQHDGDHNDHDDGDDGD